MSPRPLAAHGAGNRISARALFQGVTAQGYTGDRRAGALDFASANYRTMGMGQDESMQLIAMSAKYAQSSLSGLSRSNRRAPRRGRSRGSSSARRF